MKTLTTICFALFAWASAAVTPFTFQFNMGDGSANTNVALMTAWPPQQNTFTVVGTNIVYGGSNIVLNPNASGYGTNQAFAGSYRLNFTNLNFSFFVTLADTTNQLPLSSYVTGAPVFYEPINYYTLVTNWLSFPPATNTFIGIISVIGYTPATNTPAGIIWSLGYTPATNSYPGITNSLGFAPPTNTYAGITNALGFGPPTNTYAGFTNVVGFTFATNGGPISYSQLPYVPATNTYNGLTNVLGFKPRTNDGNIGLISSIASIATNGFVAWVNYQTNGIPGTAFTNLPTGSLLSTTNGGFYILSNLVWTPH